MSTISEFLGFRNDVAEDRFQPGDFAVCENVDLDETGRVTRRAGLVVIDATAYKNVYRHNDVTYGVRNGELGVIDNGFTPLIGVGAAVCYEVVDDHLYWIAGNSHGILRNRELLPWVANAESAKGVVNALNIDFGPKQGYVEPPAATQMLFFNGRMYYACGEFLLYSEPYDFAYLEPENFIPVGAPITTLSRVSSGIFVGTSKETLYLHGGDAHDFEMKPVASKALDGAYTYIPGHALPEKLRVDYPVPVWATSQGITAGFVDGHILNLTADKLVFPVSSKGTLAYRVCSGTPQLIFAIN